MAPPSMSGGECTGRGMGGERKEDEEDASPSSSFLVTSDIAESLE